ncbi:Vacuolar protein sorting-associated protein 9A, partial [Ananas comosus]
MEKRKKNLANSLDKKRNEGEREFGGRFVITIPYALAQKELQKINMYKAPRDKLVCILNCCKVINNLLLNVFIASDENPPGADEFLPVLIYVTIKANPPQLHSNLLYIQRYRRKSRLVSEAAYFFTNILSAETFIWNIDAQALSMDEIEFQKKMNCAREHLLGLSTTSENPVSQTKLDGTQKTEKILKTNRLSDCYLPAIRQQNNSNQANEYPFRYARAGDLSVEDVENLLNCYKNLVLKYISLSKGMGVINESLPGQNMQMLSKTETLKEFDDAKVLGINSEKDEGIYREDDVSIENLLSGGDDSETKRTSGGLVDNPSAEREEE